MGGSNGLIPFIKMPLFKSYCSSKSSRLDLLSELIGLVLFGIKFSLLMLFLNKLNISEGFEYLDDIEFKTIKL